MAGEIKGKHKMKDFLAALFVICFLYGAILLVSCAAYQGWNWGKTIESWGK